jgi:hypothetical protein
MSIRVVFSAVRKGQFFPAQGDDFLRRAWGLLPQLFHREAHVSNRRGVAGIKKLKN